MTITQKITDNNSVGNHHPDYDRFFKSWSKVRDCMDGENVIKSKQEQYLPRPMGMSGEYSESYDAYIERAHFPLITSYALSGALGAIITKLPQFNVPPELDYIIKNATKDGRSIQQLFLDIVIEILQTGRVPLLVDLLKSNNEFRFVQYKAEELINWKSSLPGSDQSLTLAVIEESIPSDDDIFSHATDTVYRVLSLDKQGKYTSRIFGEKNDEYSEFFTTPKYMGQSYTEVPMFIAGSISNSYDVQPIPLIPVANCSVQIYRKEADLANSEFLSCNPTLVVVGASNDDDLPNVVGSSVMIVLPNEAARVFYTKTDTAALTHVSKHIESLYEEAIRHGVAILDNRKGVEAAEALRIRQATQSASIYSTYLAAINAIRQGLEVMCKWSGHDPKLVVIDAPDSLAHGIPDPAVMKEVIEGFGVGVVPMTVIHRYLVYSGLLDQQVSYEEYLKLLDDQQKLKKESELANSGKPEGQEEEPRVDAEGNPIAPA